MSLNTKYRFLISPQLGINFMTPCAAVMCSKNPALTSSRQSPGRIA